MSISLAQWQQQGLYFTFNGERIFYRCSGNRHKPVLLLIHGFPTASWDGRLAEFYGNAANRPAGL